jgi:hypothetical protein
MSLISVRQTDRDVEGGALFRAGGMRVIERIVTAELCHRKKREDAK